MTEQQQFTFKAGKRGSFILDLLVNLLFLILFFSSSSLNALSIAIVLISVPLFACIMFLSTNWISVTAYEFLNSLYFSAFAVLVSYFSGGAIYYLIIPAMLILLTVRAVWSFLAPTAVATAYGLVAGQFDVDSMLICFVVALICWLVHKEYTTSSKLAEEGRRYSEEFDRLSHQHFAFATNISQGIYPTENPFNSNDALGQSLFSMSLSFKKTVEDDKIRAWQMSGLNDLGELVRSSNISSNYGKVISFLVKYTGANQAGLFLINNADPHDVHIELMACYAYEKQKMIQKKIGLTQGLIGQCILEKDIVYLEQIPDNYIHITSGLGLATPRCLAIVPLKSGDEVIGVIEVASFEPTKRHELEFLQKAADIVAASILTFQRSQYTTRMLQESQQLTEDLKSQQEEVRQNLEELEATQEHLTREAKEREKLQTKLNKSKEFLNLVLDSVPIPVFVKDREHKMVLINQAVCDLNNMTKEEMLGKSDYDFFTPEEANVFWKFEEEIFNKKGGAEKVEHAIRNGKETYTIDKKLAVSTDDGEFFLVGINIDVTESKMMERQLQNEAKILVRTRDDFKRFSNIIFEEIGLPLLNLKSLTQTAHADTEKLYVRNGNEAPNLLESTINRMYSLIDASYNYFRVGSTKKISRLDCRKMLTEIINVSKPGKIGIEIDETLPSVLFDENQMRFVLSVLINNAIKYNDKEKGRIIIKCNHIDQFIQFSVLDNGPGIGPNKREKIFDALDTIKLEEGLFCMGSSLTIAKKVIEENGGSMWVETNDQGSKFVFSLPIESVAR